MPTVACRLATSLQVFGVLGTTSVEDRLSSELLMKPLVADDGAGPVGSRRIAVVVERLILLFEVESFNVGALGMDRLLHYAPRHIRSSRWLLRWPTDLRRMELPVPIA